MPRYSDPYEIGRQRVIEKLIPWGAGAPAVDIGCHDGVLTNLLAQKGYKPVGFDLNEKIVDAARRKFPELDFRVGSVSDSAGLDRAITVCLEVIEHLPPAEQPSFVAELADTCPRGSTLLLSTPGRHSPMSIMERLRGRQWSTYNWWDPTHVGVMSWRRLRNLLGTAFTIETLHGFFFLPRRWARPFGTDIWPISTLGFDLIVLARRR